MALYSRAMFDHDNEALDAAEGVLSAAVLFGAGGDNYQHRLTAYKDDYTRIATYFWDRCPVTGKKLEKPGIDTFHVIRLFSNLELGVPIRGLDTYKYTRMIERCRRKIKGKLYQTRAIMQGKDQSKCDEPDSHPQPCQCQPLRLFEESERIAGQ